MDRFVVISADCHAVGLPEHFRTYLAAEHLDAYEESLRARSEGPDTRAKASEDGGLLFSREALEEYESHDATEDVAGGTAGQWDSARRIAELEDDGVVAEVVFPNGGPFVSGRGGEPHPRELRTAGLLAYNRWLADFCAEAPARRAGIAQLPIHDVDLAIAEVERAAASGLRGVTVPILFDDPDAPPLYHERYEPLWAACEAHGQPVHVHGGAGPDYGDGIDPLTRIMLYVTEVPMWPKRILWFLLWNGTLERHPGLHLVFTEGTSDWVPAAVSYLDYLYGSKDFAHVRRVLPSAPSEYWNRQCHVGASSVSRAETDLRHQIGVDRMMFGSDYPHVEGTWPRTRDWVRATLGGIPVDEQRRILGENAAELYGFDLAVLAPIAERVGIPVADLTTRAELPSLAHTQVDRPGVMADL
jgi:predicted TIM-barrel fold metal-dependent hydrolase